MQKLTNHWIDDYSRFRPKSDPDGHWGKGQTGFNLSEDGKIYLSDNKPIPSGKTFKYPSHRDLIMGSGNGRTIYAGIYSWGYEGDPTLWLYPDTERVLNEQMREALASLIGVHRITKGTPVRSNTFRGILFRLSTAW